MLGGQEGTTQVHAQHRVPLARFDVDQRLHQVADAGVVDQDVQATETLHRGLHHGLDLRFFQHVQRHRDALATGRRRQVGGDLRHLLIGAHRGHRHLRTAALADIGQHHLATFLQQATGNALAQTGTTSGTGDQGDLAFEFGIAGSHGVMLLAAVRGRW